MKSPTIVALGAAAAIPALAFAASPTPPPTEQPKHERFEPDANHDGVLSRAEALAAADSMFKRLDANGDGKLMPGEHPDRPHRGPPGGAPDKQAEGAGPPPAPGAAPPPDGGPGRWAGKRAHFMDHRGGPGMGRGPMGFLGQDVFTEYDANHDGALSLTEFRAHAGKVFDAQDGNRDGKVKLPERPAMGQGRGEGMGPPPGAPPPKE